jgi:CubicO group peptidase (beta-lactamase class C family)
MADLRSYWPTDGWRDASPDAHNMDGARLDEARGALAQQAPHMTSLLIARGGHLVEEWYAEGTGPDTLHNVMSVTKSVLSLLVGIAIQTGDLEGIDASLGDLLPDFFTSSGDARKRAITIRDLLSMRSGLAWEEYGSSTVEMTASKNWVRHVLDVPLEHDPGERFNYSTGDTQLVSAMLGRATGMTALAFADLYLFGPLGIERRTWPADPQEVTVGGAELSLTPRDMAKIGYLVLNEGRWEGSAVVPAAWIAESIEQQALVVPPGARNCPAIGYGYLWWLRPQGDFASAMAVGFGGQYIYVIPERDLVVVMTGDTSSPPEQFRSNRMLCEFNFVEEMILPAAGE